MDTINNLPEIEKLRLQLQQTQLPANLLEKAHLQIERIALTLKYGGNLSQLDVTTKYIDWITHLPWFAQTEDIMDISRARAVLDQNHYGLGKIKERVMEYISELIIQKQNLHLDSFQSTSLFFVGLAGTGKTTFAKSIAEALGRKFVRIPFGGLSSAQDLRGQSKITPEAEPSLLMKALRHAGSKNPVILLDELDRVTTESRASIMGVLIELLDPEQSHSFTDYFIDYPFDLSQVLFVATANNTKEVATAVLDRLEVVQMPSYTDEEKIAIGKNYVLPHYMKNLGLTTANLSIDHALWEKLVRPLGFEPGIRSVERLIETIVRRVALKTVSGQGTSFYINDSNYKEFVN